MKIVLATGIYPPDIGGPATYVQAIAQELEKRGMEVVVVTYGAEETEATDGTEESEETKQRRIVVWVLKTGGPFLRWWRYARALREHAADADVVLVFSLVSVGMPLWIARLRKPKFILRLGGDFLWERYTDFGGTKTLREFYQGARGFRFQVLGFRCTQWLLRQFDHVVFSTQFQKGIYVEHYRQLPSHSVIENALPAPIPDPFPRPNGCSSGRAAAAGEGRARHTPFRLLFLGRFVAFKNLSALLRAMTELPGITLTLVGDGPLRHFLEGSVRGLRLQDRVVFRPKVSSMERDAYFREHDLLVVPSVTEISPNVALEAQATGLPVLLTEETGLSGRLQHGMVIRKLRTTEQVCDAIREVIANYERVAEEAAQPVAQRGWGVVGEEYLQLFDRIFHLPVVAPHPGPLPRGEGNLLMISGDRALASGRRGAFWQTLEELRKHWGRIDILCPHAACHAEPVEASRGVALRRAQSDTAFSNVFLHSSPRGLWYQPLWILRKGKELSRQRQYSVMTVHDYPPFYNGLGAWLLHRSRGIPWVAEIHHVVGYPAAASFVEWIGSRMYFLYFRTIGRSAAAFRVVNAGAQELLARWGVRRERVHLVPSFYLDHELLRPDPLIPKEYDIVFCGRLVANKGVEELLRAVGHVALRRAQGDTTPRLLVIGDGPLCQKLKAESYNLKARITFVGWLPIPRDVYRAMQSAKMFVMCSKSEGGPRIALEAMALGLPVIATRVGVMPEVIEDGVNGLFTTGDPGDIAKKIQWLLSDDRLRARMGTEAKKVLGRFEKRRLIRQYADFLQSFA